MEESQATNTEETSIIKTLARGGSIVLIGRIAGVVVGFCATLILARFFGTGVLGEVRYVLSVSSVAVLLTMGGYGEGVERFIPTADSPIKAWETFFTSVAITVGSAVVIGTGIILTAPLLSQLIFSSGEFVIYLWAVGITLPFTAFYYQTISAAKGWNWATPSTVLPNLVRPSIKLVGFSIVLATGMGKLGLAVTIGLVEVILGIGAVVVLVHIARSRASLPVSWRASLSAAETILPTRSTAIRLSTYSIPLLLSRSVWMVMNQADTLMIGYLLDEAAVGIYSVAFSLAILLNIVINSAGALFFPNMARLNQDSEIETIRVIYRLVTKWMVILSLPILLGMIGFSPAVLGVFGADFIGPAAQVTLIVLTLGLFSHVIFGLNIDLLKATDRTREILYTQSVIVVLNIGLNFVLIQEYGISGAALATGISYLLSNLIFSAWLYRSIAIVPVSLQFITFSLLWIVAGIAIPRLTVLPEANLIIGIGYGIVWYGIYLIVVYKFNFISREELQMIKTAAA